MITKADELTRLSLRNAHGVHLLDSGQLNTRDVLVSDHVVFTQEALDSFVARATGGAARCCSRDAGRCRQRPGARPLRTAPAAADAWQPSPPRGGDGAGER